MNKSILHLDQVVSILKDSGYVAIMDCNEYGSAVQVKHEEKWLHVIDYRDLDGCHTVLDILNKASNAIIENDKPKNPNADILVEDLMKYIS